MRKKREKKNRKQAQERENVASDNALDWFTYMDAMNAIELHCILS